MFFEIQLSSGVFNRMIRNRIKSAVPCLDLEFPDGQGGSLVVDQVHVTDDTAIMREQKPTQVVWVFSPANYTSFTVPFLQVKQEVQVQLVSSADLAAHGPQPSPPTQTLSIRPIYNVRLEAANQAQGGGPVTLSYALASVDYGALGPLLPPTARALIDEFLGTTKPAPVTLDLKPLSVLLKRPVQACNAGISHLRDLPDGSLDAVETKPFAWQVLGSCRGNGKNNFQIGNQATIDVICTPPAKLCSVRKLDDPENEFKLTTENDSVLLTPRFSDSYTVAPYPCRIRVITTRGVRTITFPPPAPLGAAEHEELERARIAAIASCYYWERQFFDPKEKIHWLSDPPFDPQRHLQFWQIVVRGMHQHESLDVATSHGTRLLTARASAAGVAHVTVLLSGPEATEELSLELIGEPRETKPPREISLQQVLFERRASLAVRAEPQRMRFEGGSRLIVVDGDEEVAWDVRNPQAPALASAVRHDGDRPEFPLYSGKRLGDAPTSTALRALDRLRGRLGEPEAVGTPRVGGAGETLSLRTVQQAALYDISDTAEPRQIQTFDRPAWFEGIAMGGSLLARHDAGSGEIGLYEVVANRLR